MKRTAWNLVTIASLVLIGVVAFLVSSFIAGDACLDSGGRWDYLTWQCDR